MSIFNKKYNYNHNFYLFLIYFLWLIFLMVYFFFSAHVEAGALKNGVSYGSDSIFYLRESRNILNGDISILKYKGYFGYLLFLATFLYFELPLYYAVLFQVVLTGISALCLYKITQKFFCKSSGLICVALFLFYLPLQLRNFYILTEILFIDISIILTCFIVFFKKKFLIPTISLLIFLISIRPNGSLFLFSILASFFIYIVRDRKYFYLIFYLSLIIILSVPGVSFLNSYLAELNLIGALNRGIIWGYSFETNQICKSSCLSVELINNNFSNTLIGYFEFVLVNFTEYFKIFFYKVFWFVVRIRPYYSDLHNFYLLVFNIILYLSFIYGFVKRPKNLFSLNCIIIYMLFSTILVGLTFADWSGRFSLFIIPLIMIFSSYGLLFFIKKVLNMIK